MKKGEVTAHELTRAQQSVARRIAEARAIVPDATWSVEADVTDALTALEGTPAGLEDLVVHACGVALRDHPRANGAYRDGRWELHDRINVGVVVEAEDALAVPTVFDADSKDLRTIAAELAVLRDRARSGEITSPEVSGGTFTVSSSSARRHVPVVLPGQAAHLAVGAAAPRALVRDGRVVARPAMDLTLAGDHRILFDGVASAFLARVRELLEAPAALLG